MTQQLKVTFYLLRESVKLLKWLYDITDLCESDPHLVFYRSCSVTFKITIWAIKCVLQWSRLCMISKSDICYVDDLLI